MTKFVEYHSWEWACLVETGWLTMTVDNVNGVAIAKMLRVWR